MFDITVSDVINCPINQNVYNCITFFMYKKVRFNFEQPAKFNTHEYGLKRKNAVLFKEN